MEDKKQVDANNDSDFTVRESDCDSEADAETALVDRQADDSVPHPLEQDGAPEDPPGGRELAQEINVTMQGETRVKTSFRRKLLITVLIYWNVSTMGMVYAQMGPVLPDLQLITGSSLQQITWLFTGFGIGYFVGCLVAGIAQEKFHPSLVLFVCTLGTGITAGVLPWIEIIYVSVGIKFIHGITNAGQDTVCISMIFAIWREKSGPFNQIIDIVFAAGCFLSQFYTKPFMRDEKAFQVQELVVMSRNDCYTESPNGTMDAFHRADTNVHYAFLISALLSVSAALPFLLMYIFKEEDPAASSADIQNKRDMVARPAKSTYVILGIFFTTNLITNACIEAFPNLLTTFVLRQVRWTQQSASTLTAVYFALSCLGNILGVFVLKYFTANKLFVASYAGAILGLIGCMIGSLLEQNVVIWVTIVIIGISMVCIIPTSYIWIEENVTHVTGRITSGMLLFGSVGQIVNPILLGYLMDNHSPMWFVIITLSGIILCAIFYTLSFLLVKRFSPKFT